MTLNESIVEDVALEWFGELGYVVGHGPHPAPGKPAAERDSFEGSMLTWYLHDALRRLNSAIASHASSTLLPKLLNVELRVAGHIPVETT